MTRLDAPSLVADEYADDARLRRRAAAYTGEATAFDARRELVGSGPSTLKFSREDGYEHLGRHFARVTRDDIDGRLEFAVRAEVEEYVRASISMSPFVANLPAVVDEPFFARRANSIFVAEKAT